MRIDCKGSAPQTLSSLAGAPENVRSGALQNQCPTHSINPLITIHPLVGTKMPFFSKVFRSKDGGAVNAKTKSRKQSNLPELAPAPPPKPRWDDAWSRKDVEPEEIQELLRECTAELKSRGSNVSRGKGPSAIH